MAKYGLNSSVTGTSGGLFCEHDNDPGGFHRMRGCYWIDEELLASQE